MEKIAEIYKKIWELKTKSKIEDVKTQIQKLQQSVDNDEVSDKPHSDKREIENFLYKRYER